MDKFALIYEFNNSSPLFAYCALKELEKNNTERSLEILENGIQLYPDYAPALIVYAKALTKAGEFDNAKEILIKACELIDSKESFDYYYAELESIKVKEDQFSASRRTNFVPDNFDELINEESVEEFSSADLPSLYKDDELDKLAEELSNAHINVSPSLHDEPEELIIEEEPQKEEQEIISETLASIYFAQENYEEAIRMYSKLIEFNPEKADFFKKRIEEIDELLEKGPSDF